MPRERRVVVQRKLSVLGPRNRTRVLPPKQCLMAMLAIRDMAVSGGPCLEDRLTDSFTPEMV